MAKWLFLTLLLFSLAAQATPTVLAQEESLYHTTFITEEDGLRCLRFSLVLPGRQSCVDPQNPQKLIFENNRLMLGALYLQPQPKRILMIGLGGGSLPTALRHLFPQAMIESVEIDPVVAKLAEQYFFYRPDDHQKITIADGRVFIKRAAEKGTRYDLVLLDAYNKNYIPEHMLTKEFLQEVKTIMAAGGVLAANTAASGALYPAESATYAAVFGRFYNLKPKIRVIIAARDALPEDSTLHQNATNLAPALRPLGIEPETLLPLFNPTPDWPTDSPVLTDQYSPANLLQGR